MQTTPFTDTWISNLFAGLVDSYHTLFFLFSRLLALLFCQPYRTPGFSTLIICHTMWVPFIIIMLMGMWKTTTIVANSLSLNGLMWVSICEFAIAQQQQQQQLLFLFCCRHEHKYSFTLPLSSVYHPVMPICGSICVLNTIH